MKDEKRSLLYFLKNTRTSSRVLIVLWLFFSVLAKFSEESRLLIIYDFSVTFLFPAIVNELCKNPFFHSEESLVIAFLRSSKTVSRVLLHAWSFTALLAAQSDVSNFIYTFPLMAIPFFLPAVVIERKNNPFWHKSLSEFFETDFNVMR